MAKILFLSAQYPPESKGGGELSTHIIAQGLKKLGHSVHVITSGLHADQRTVDGIPVQALPLGLREKPLFERSHSRKAARILRSHILDLASFDIIHAHDFRSALMLAQCGMKNAVVTARDYAQISGCTNNIQKDGNIAEGCQGINEFYLCHRVAEASFIRKLFRIWQYNYNLPYRRSAFQSFQHQLFISHSQLKLIAAHQTVSHQHTAVIYNSISQEYLSEPLMKGKQYHVLYAGRVEMYKGVLVLLKAWREIVKSNNNAHLTIAGDGAQREEYERLTTTWGMQNRVTFIPHIPHQRLRALINDAEVLVAPHLWVEPFGRTVIEGMSRGKIVVASNVGGPAEIIEHAKTGLLFERGSVSDLTRTLEHAFSMSHSDKKEMGELARNVVRDTLNMEKIAKEHEAFYEEVVSSI